MPVLVVVLSLICAFAVTFYYWKTKKTKDLLVAFVVLLFITLFLTFMALNGCL